MVGSYATAEKQSVYPTPQADAASVFPHTDYYMWKISPIYVTVYLINQVTWTPFDIP